MISSLNVMRAIRKIRKTRQDTWLPYFMPRAWKLIIGFVFLVGIAIGVVIAFWMLSVRRLM